MVILMTVIQTAVKIFHSNFIGNKKLSQSKFLSLAVTTASDPLKFFDPSTMLRMSGQIPLMVSLSNHCSQKFSQFHPLPCPYSSFFLLSPYFSPLLFE